MPPLTYTSLIVTDEIRMCFKLRLELNYQSQTYYLSPRSSNIPLKVFSAIDENGDGSLSADEWLQFCRQEIVGKVE